MAAKDALGPYRDKRDFTATTEPGGKAGARRRRGQDGIFVIQRHAARALHYDFRLELDGVLKSWAVPKGPSRDPTIKRLAVAVEDHPLDYATFSGDIPKGHYGAGHVDIWDGGTWRPTDADPAAALAKGRLHFSLSGRILAGEWILIRTGRDGKSWLLRKLDDAHVVADDDAEAIAPGGAEPRKATPAAKPAARSKPAPTPRARRAAMPTQLSPQLATLAEAPPDGDNWRYEMKYDGYRMLCRVDGADVQWLSRTGKDWTDRMRPLAESVGRLRLGKGWIDGEVVVFGKNGQTDFQALQNALDARSDALHFIAFDLPYWGGKDLRGLPLDARQAQLAELLADVTNAPIRLTDRFEVRDAGEARDALAQACAMGFEGLIAKDGDAPYTDTRSRTWLKLKCRPRQEFVVGGYTSPAGSRTGFGALLVGLRDGGKLHFAGRIGTGFDTDTLDALTARLRKLRIDKSPFAAALPAGQRRFAGAVRDLHWVQPELVVEAEFAGWTGEGVLRQASFAGLREDKPARDVGPEHAMPSPASSRANPVAGVRITHPDRRLFRDPDYDKLDLADYYDAVGEVIMPHLRGRRLAMLRCPNGTASECFFQKHIAQRLPVGVRRDGEHILAANPKGVVALAQNGVIELHTWGSTLPRADRADRLTFDLDPGPGIEWPALVEAAQLTAALLRELGMVPFLKTTGGKGLHVVTPIRRTLDWPAAKTFAAGLAKHLAGLMPERFTANMSKARRQNRIFIDYLRNGENATAIAAFAVRARAGAPVSLPIDWDALDVKQDLRGDAFNIRNVPDLLAQWRDPWVDYAHRAATVTRDLQDAFGQAR